LLLYTDGLTEIDRAPESGERKLRELFRSISNDHEDLSATRIVERMTDGAASRDDVAVLVLNVRAPIERDQRGRTLLQRWSLHTGDVRSVTASRRAFAEAFRDHGAADEDVALGELVFGELVGNTVRYAPGAVEVIVDWSGPDPVLHVLDEGPGFRHISILPPDVLSESGRGLFIVRSLTHDFRVSGGPNGGSHARAVLRMRSRQLIDLQANAIPSAPLHAFDDRAGVVQSSSGSSTTSCDASSISTGVGPRSSVRSSS
jgi:anti-sigma regulatory factor (Ser/Thr protein kinase)